MSAAPLVNPSLIKVARLPVIAAVLTIGLKFGAYAFTDSAGLLSDAIESTVNLVAAVAALFALWYAAKPIDRSHTYGHEKIEFFSSGLEGGMVLVAAISILWFAGDRLIHPQPLEGIGIGTALAIGASAINLGMARLLFREADRHDSLVLRASGRHLMTDVWTSAGVIVGIVVVKLTGIDRLDPIIAILVALNIARTGWDLVHASVGGLLDAALPSHDEEKLREAISRHLEPGTTYHALRTRQSGSRRFADFHLLAPGAMSLHDAHAEANRIEEAIAGVLPGLEVTIHLEPIEDPTAWDDTPLLAIERGGRQEAGGGWNDERLD